MSLVSGTVKVFDGGNKKIAASEAHWFIGHNIDSEYFRLYSALFKGNILRSMIFTDSDSDKFTPLQHIAGCYTIYGRKMNFFDFLGRERLIS